jgi:hypothetical protein
MGADGPQAAVEAIAGGAHGFCVVLSLPFLFLFLFLFWLGSRAGHATCFLLKQVTT